MIYAFNKNLCNNFYNQEIFLIFLILDYFHKIGSKEQLSEFEKGHVTILHDQSHNYNKIGQKIERDGETCKRYYQDKQNYGNNCKT